MKTGVPAALAAVGAAHTPPESAGEDPLTAIAEAAAELGLQRGLFDRPGELENGAKQVAERSGPGRPPGATNKRTGKLAEYILALGFRHPALTLAELASDPRKLTKFGLKPAEAVEVVRKAAADLLPYFESKMPTAIALPDDPGDRAMLIVGEIVRGGKSARPDGAIGLDDPVLDLEEDQALSGGEAVRPAAEPSHETQ